MASLTHTLSNYIDLVTLLITVVSLEDEYNANDFGLEFINVPKFSKFNIGIIGSNILFSITLDSILMLFSMGDLIFKDYNPYPIFYSLVLR